MKRTLGLHPINLAVRFMLEIAALMVMGLWGWKLSDGWLRYAMVLAIPIIAGAIWGIFAVPEDPSRSGSAPIPVLGIIRLGIELMFFGVATWALYDTGFVLLTWIYGILVIIHYAISYDRIFWLLKR